jgi:hypothetical protein
MSEKGQKSRPTRHSPTHRRDTMEAIFERRRAAGRVTFPGGKALRIVRAPQPLADAFPPDPEVEEGVCAGCWLERRAWQGNEGRGYVRDGARYCCQECVEGCVDGYECPCRRNSSMRR